MANVNTAYGLRPVSRIGSVPSSNGTTQYQISASDTNKIYTGMPVVVNTTGYISRVGNATGNNVKPLGVFMGCQYTSATELKPVWSPYWPGSGALSTDPVYAMVADDPMQVFAIASNGSMTQANVFQNANLASGQSGTDATGISSAVLDTSTIAGGTAAQKLLRIIGFADEADNNDLSAAGATVLVRLQNHYNAPGFVAVVA